MDTKGLPYILIAFRMDREMRIKEETSLLLGIVKNFKRPGVISQAVILALQEVKAGKISVQG
jgi:hypothetical protein